MGMFDQPAGMFATTGPIFASAGQQYGLDPLVLQAIHLAETGGTGRWDVRSPAGAMGGMQLMPSTARALGVSNPYDPNDAIPGAAKGLAQLLGSYEKRVGVGPDALTMALKAYNAGPNQSRWNNPETAGYPDAVLKYYQQLQQQVQQAQVPTFPPDSGAF